MKMNPVVHFEMPAKDTKRMADFYTRAFGWQTKQLGPEMGNYVTVMTTEVGSDQRPKEPGAINGGFFTKSKGHAHTSVVIAVDDIYEAMKKVEEAGGKIVGGSKPGVPDDIPGVGVYIAFADTEGNQVALLQPTPSMDVHPGQ